MRMREMIFPAVLLASALLVAGPGAASAQRKLVKIDGSSTVYPVTEAVAEEYQKAKRGAVQVTVGISGTGGGFKKFCRGETDISGASRPILKQEMEACRKSGISYFELPVAFDALTVVVNPKNDWAGSMTVAELKKLWEPAAQGKITRWSQIRAGWPDERINLYGAGADSGTFDYFTEAIVGKSKSSRGDFTASEDDNVLVQGVERDKYALGFFGYAYYAAHSKTLKAVAIIEKPGAPAVKPSLETVIAGKYNPLGRPIFIYVNKKAAGRPEVKEFVDFYLKEGAGLVKEVKYVPLPAKAYGMARERFVKGVTGTAFGGVPEVGLPIEAILKREPKS